MRKELTLLASSAAAVNQNRDRRRGRVRLHSALFLSPATVYSASHVPSLDNH
jgi:hypothetical protein